MYVWHETRTSIHCGVSDVSGGASASNTEEKTMITSIPYLPSACVLACVHVFAGMCAQLHFRFSLKLELAPPSDYFTAGFGFAPIIKRIDDYRPIYLRHQSQLWQTKPG